MEFHTTQTSVCKLQGLYESTLSPAPLYKIWKSSNVWNLCGGKKEKKREEVSFALSVIVEL